MKTDFFLQNIAEFLIIRYGSELSDHTLVFPNRRAIVYFQKYLAVIENKPVWSPHCTTINELMQQFSGLHVADDITLNFELYKIYKEEKKSEESFDRFYHWGEMLLNDFDDIDKYLVDVSLLFRTLASIKEIEKQFNFLTDEQIESIRQFWKSFEPDNYSRHQQDFIEIWKVLFAIYTKFKQVLTEKGLAYEGMLWRDVADKCITSKLDLRGHKKICFIGFNALNKCEKVLFDFLQKEKSGEFYWDYDAYYIKNPEHEAGYFLRDNIKKYPSPIQDEDHNYILGTEKKIQFISASSDIAQTKLIQQILKEWDADKPDSPDRTAIVLADETLLLPVLFAIPPEVGTINVTMGYPLSSSPAYSFFEHLLDVQKNTKVKENGTVLYYFRNVLKVLNHQYVKAQSKDIIEEITDHIIIHNRVYLSASEIQKNEFLTKLFIYHDNAKSLTESLLGITEDLYNMLGDDPENPTLEQEYVHCLYKGIKRINEILVSHKVNFGLPVFYKLLRQALRGVRIPFEGEPLAGLQVMGILETRAIDFDNLILLSTNEGLLPQSSSGSSFVPYNLRRAFELPTIEHQDSIYGYYFYRLLQRAKNVALVYNTNTNEHSSGEMSRFMLQLKYQSKLNIIEKNLMYDISFITPKTIQINKSDKVFETLNKYKSGTDAATRSFSASALNMYIDCSLKFYFRYIAGLEEAEEVTEDIDAANFGRLLHKTMELLYSPYLNKSVDNVILEALISDLQIIEKCILEAFRLEYFKTDTTLSLADITGKNILIYEIIKKYILQILKFDISQTPFKIKELEEKYKVQFPVEINGQQFSITLGGFFDRVDESEAGIRIIDYKTGSENREFKMVQDLFIKGDAKRCKEAFQTFYYSLIYSIQHKTLQLHPSLYFVRAMFNNEFNGLLIDKTLKIFVASYQPYDADFRKNLEDLCAEIYDPQISFSQTDDITVCKNCAYAEICHR